MSNGHITRTSTCEDLDFIFNFIYLRLYTFNLNFSTPKR